MVRLGEAKQFSNKALNKPLTKPLKNGLVSGLLLLAVACSDHALEFSLVTVFVFMSICSIALIIVHCYNSEVNILGRISAAQAAIFIRFLCFYALCLSPNAYVTMQPR